MPVVELQFAGLPAHVRTARLVAAAMGRRSGLTSSQLDEVKLAVGEAASRAVSVHRRNGSVAPVVVRFCDDDGSYTVEVFDSGPAGEDVPPGEGDGSRTTARELLDIPATQSPDDHPSPLPSGLGLALIEGLVDDVTVGLRDDGPGTRVTMRWPAQPPARHEAPAGQEELHPWADEPATAATAPSSGPSTAS